MIRALALAWVVLTLLVARPAAAQSASDVLCEGVAERDQATCQLRCKQAPASGWCLIARRFGGSGWPGVGGSAVVDELALSAVVLAGGSARAGAGAVRPAGSDGVLSARDISRADMRATELVVLSACDTGRGRHLVSGEGAQGLGRAFLIAGAGAVVASSWSVPSSETRDLMEGFYERLLQTPDAPLDPVAALRGAQLEALEAARAEGVRHSAFLWGAFSTLSRGIR